MIVRPSKVAVVSLLPLILLACSCQRATQSAQGSKGAPPEIDRVTPLPNPLPEVIARVNGIAISRGLVLALAAQTVRGKQENDPAIPGAVREAMHQYIIRELLVQEAMARGIAPSAQEVQSTADAARAAVRDEKQWQARLAAEGLDENTFEAEVRAQKTVAALLAKTSEDAPVPSEDEVAAFYAANPAMFWQAEVFKVSRILVIVPRDATAEKKAALKKKADGIVAQLETGKSFRKLAVENSDDPEGRKAGGLMPAFVRGSAPPPVEAALLAMKPGETTGAIETASGFEILLLHERIEGRAATLDEVKPRVIDALQRKAGQDRLQTLVNSLRAKARIETYI